MKKKYKPIPLAGLGGVQGFDMLRIPHCLDTRLTDGGEVLDLIHWQRSTPLKHYFSPSGTLSKPHDIIGTRTRGFPVCSIVPQPSTLPRATNQFMMYSDIVTVCCENCTEQINILCGQNVEVVMAKLAGRRINCCALEHSNKSLRMGRPNDCEPTRPLSVSDVMHEQPTDIQGASKRAWELWKPTYIYSEDTCSVLNCFWMQQTPSFAWDSYGAMWLSLLS
jgi:hypothetical protein